MEWLRIVIVIIKCSERFVNNFINFSVKKACDAHFGAYGKGFIIRSIEIVYLSIILFLSVKNSLIYYLQVPFIRKIVLNMSSCLGIATK